MELWAIVPELILAGGILLLLPLGSFLPWNRKSINHWLALLFLAAAAIATARMTSWSSIGIFDGTYVVDALATYTKVIGIAATALTLLATESHFRGKPREAEVAPLLLLTCLGVFGLAASADLVLIALFLQITTVGAYLLVGIDKENRRATEGAVKFFLFSAAAGAVMLYGMAILYGLTGSLSLAEIGVKLSQTRAGLFALALILAGYGYKAAIVPFHAWVPDAYQGAPAPIAGFISVAPKAAAFAVLLRTLTTAFPHAERFWSSGIAVMAAVTMTFGNIAALRQTSAKRLIAYSSIAQAGYLLVGVAASMRDPLATSGLLFYLFVYVFMNIGAFVAIDALERATGSDDIANFAGASRILPLPSAALAVSALALAGFPPFGSFAAKSMLFGAAISAGWVWLAIVMAINTALSLYYYVRLIQPMYFGANVISAKHLPGAMVAALLLLIAGSLLTGIVPGRFALFTGGPLPGAAVKR